MTELDFSKFQFRPIIALPSNYEVFDFTSGYDPRRTRLSEYGVGRYNEIRMGMYTSELFLPKEEPGLINKNSEQSPRNIHMGIDIAAPIGTPVFAFYNGTVCMTGINPALGDYGGTIITEHLLGETKIWALYGHLSHASTVSRKSGDQLSSGDVVGWIGSESENGGWNPHVHFQLSLDRPCKCDLPGVVSRENHQHALEIYPDPRLVLGRLY